MSSASPDSSQPAPPAEVGYLELIRSNRHFRGLWLGHIASLLGDWFNTIALYTLVRELTGSPLALGLVFLCKMLPLGLASPVAGLIADRFDRRRLMIACDLIRAVLVLGFLLVDEPSEIGWLYGLIALQVMVGAPFLPARSASIPNVTGSGELLTANALSAATWSAMLAIGAALGGFATEWLGLQAVFLIDSFSYLVSAWFLSRITIRQETDAAPPLRGFALVRRAVADIADGWVHMQRFPRIGRIALAKATWAIGGGALVYSLALVGEAFRPAAPAVGIGVLYAIRGLGTGIGPVLARRFIPRERQWPTVLGLCTIISGVCYLGVGLLPWHLAFLALVLVAHSTSGANWVLSMVMLQRRTEDRFRGRVFATEWLLLTTVDVAAILAASLLLERQILELRPTILLFATIQVLTGVLWLLTVVPKERALSSTSTRRDDVRPRPRR